MQGVKFFLKLLKERKSRYLLQIGLCQVKLFEGFECDGPDA
jgi:hypothetical protein